MKKKLQLSSFLRRYFKNLHHFNNNFLAMANKKNLKKMINYICSDLFSECVAASLYAGKKDKEDVNAILSAILMLHKNYTLRVSHPEPGISSKAYFKDLREKFNAQVSEIVDQIANI